MVRIHDFTFTNRFNIYDVGLRKICKKIKIPTPPIEHWQRFQNIKSIKLPAIQEKYSQKEEVTLISRLTDTLGTVGHIAMLNRLQKELENNPTLIFQVPPKLSNPDKLIKEAKKSISEKRNRTSYHGVAIFFQSDFKGKKSPEGLARWVPSNFFQVLFYM